jgi:hypothetical protein
MLVTGCIGLWRRDYHAGRSTGDLGACVPFNFEVSIEEGNRITGVAATTDPRGTASWNVSKLLSGLDILVEARTDDPRVPEQIVRWKGRRHAVSLEVTEEGIGPCAAPRTATLHHK